MAAISNNKSMKRQHLCISFGFRSEEGRRNGGGTTIPLNHAWQEDANDLHVHIRTSRDSESVVPEVHKRSGDYILPYDECLGDRDELLIVPRYMWHPSGLKEDICWLDGVLAYDMTWGTTALTDKEVAPKSYLRLLESCWYSPNR